MRIAIIGAGIAGLGAAWTLSKSHEVVIYEKGSYLGGHARTIHYPSSKGEMIPADVGFLVFNPWMYPNLSAMFAHFDVETMPCPWDSGITAIFDNDTWKKGLSTPLWERVKNDAWRFEVEAQNILLNPEKYLTVSTGEYLDQNGYSSEFKYKCFIPLISTLTITRQNALSVSILTIASLFGPIPLYSFFQISHWYTVTNGSREYVNKLVGDIDAKFLLNCGVKSIQRSESQVIVECENGNRDYYDHVVLATEADTALAILSDALPEEKALLGAMEYELNPLVLHTDTSVAPSDRSLWTKFNYMASGERPPFKDIYYSWYIPLFQPWIEDDLFVSLNLPEGLIDPQKVIATINWKHLLLNPAQGLASSQLHQIQGKNRTWFCGEYASALAGHDLSFITGLAVGKALGADYPFEDNLAAKTMFYDHTIYHMKLLPESAAPKAPDTYAFPVQLGKQIHQVLRSLMASQAPAGVIA